MSCPLTTGDNVLMLFTQYNPSTWKEGNGTVPVSVQGTAKQGLNHGVCIAGLHTLQSHLLPHATDVEIKFKDSSIRLTELGDVSVTTKGNVIVTAEKSLDADIGGNVIVTAGGDIDATATGEATVTATAITLNGPTTINGALVVNGGISGTGGAGMTMAGNITGTGGDITSDGVSVKTHTHPGDSGGTTGTPN